MNQSSRAGRAGTDLNTLTLVLIPIGIVINIVIGQLIYILKLPIYLDSIGTVLVGVLAGPWIGALTGALSIIIWAVSGLNPSYFWYFPVAGIIGLLAGIFAQSGWLRELWRVALAGLITGFVAAIISAPITAALGGVTGSGTDAIIAVLRASGANIVQAAFGQGIVSDPLDKMASFLVVWAIVRALPGRFLDRFPRAEDVQ
jgi:energy-coupling factor transport system substrate-specific component